MVRRYEGNGGAQACRGLSCRTTRSSRPFFSPPLWRAQPMPMRDREAAAAAVAVEHIPVTACGTRQAANATATERAGAATSTSISTSMAKHFMAAGRPRTIWRTGGLAVGVSLRPTANRRSMDGAVSTSAITAMNQGLACVTRQARDATRRRRPTAPNRRRPSRATRPTPAFRVRAPRSSPIRSRRGTALADAGGITAMAASAGSVRCRSPTTTSMIMRFGATATMTASGMTAMAKSTPASYPVAMTIPRTTCRRSRGRSCWSDPRNRSARRPP